jgi:transposase InsO family protein
MHPSALGSNFILVMVDIATRFVLLRALKTKSSPEVASHLLQIFCDVGFPLVLQSDNGTEFLNALITELTNAAQVEQRFSLPYHPEANGVAERWVQTSTQTPRRSP